MITRCARCIRFNNKSINCITFSSKSIIPKLKSKSSLIDSSNETKLSSLSMFLSLSQDKISSKKYVMHPDLMKSIQIYYSQNKHMKIPKAFIVPYREPWPQELWGYPLGSEFHIVRDIEGIGINRSDTVISKKEMTQMVLETFKMYKKIYCHLDIKKDFVVQPNDNRWPSSMIGYPLGMLRYSIMSGNYKSIHSELDKIGFIWRYAEVRYEKILLALKIYKKLYGNLYIKVSFVVPNDNNNWPKELHGYKLGRLCDNIRFKYINVDFIKPELDELGFIWNFAEYRWNMIERSFIIFKEQYGHLNVRRLYVVPNKEPWPMESWGFKLGQVTYNIRKRGDYYRFHKKLNEMGFVWESERMIKSRLKNSSINN